MIARLALVYLTIFAIVLVLLSAGAYVFLAREYYALLQPALATPEGAQAYHSATQRVALTIFAFDLPLLALVGVASWLLARTSIEPLIASREREREFAADAAHRLRTPLATIAAMAQSKVADADGATADALRTISRAALDASQTVGELLTLSRPADARLLVCEPVDLAAIARDVSKEFAPVSAQQGFDLKVETQSAIVDGDERRLREIIRNLLENALRYARHTIVVATRTNGKSAELFVRNDGSPVSAELRERIFERAYSIDSGGTGLGLALVRWIARAHGGEAFVREYSGGGAEFVVQFPLIA